VAVPTLQCCDLRTGKSYKPLL